MLSALFSVHNGKARIYKKNRILTIEIRGGAKTSDFLWSPKGANRCLHVILAVTTDEVKILLFKMFACC